jgi:hypothetical protein
MATGTRLAAALTVLSFALGNLGSLVHQATTTHTRCAEHGELIHGEQPVPDDHAGPALELELADDRVARPSSDPARLRGLPPAAGHDEHEHCFVTAPTRERADPAAHATVDLAPACERSPLALADNPGSAGRPLYQTAPKTSPPA